jgi:bifunctional N-acetylglucosamine-1-phosphate-uridyltransferase/glucosamine-1-phosphate-acetyltransferase GlmU-like protein
MSAIALILAAGKGTRMKSDLPKPLVRLKNKPLLKYIVENFQKAMVKEIGIIVGYQAEAVRKNLGESYAYIYQEVQKGTAHAVLHARDKINWKGKDVFVFVGDSPLISTNTIRRLHAHHRNSGADCTFLTADFGIKLPYARVVKDAKGKLIRCVEEKNASPEELQITELLSSHFVFKGDLLFAHIEEIEADRQNGEYYLTDILDIFLKKGYKVDALKIEHYEELVGLNTPEDLLWAEQFLNQN